MKLSLKGAPRNCIEMMCSTEIMFTLFVLLVSAMLLFVVVGSVWFSLSTLFCAMLFYAFMNSKRRERAVPRGERIISSTELYTGSVPVLPVLALL